MATYYNMDSRLICEHLNLKFAVAHHTSSSGDRLLDKFVQLFY